jgi:hypothetical protein
MKKKSLNTTKSVKRHPFTRKDKQFLIAELQLTLLTVTVNKAAKHAISVSHSRRKNIGISNPILNP